MCGGGSGGGGGAGSENVGDDGGDDEWGKPKVTPPLFGGPQKQVQPPGERGGGETSLYCPRRNYYWINSGKGGSSNFYDFSTGMNRL